MISDKKYQVIYADPPWRYEHPVSNSRRIENQYPTMCLDDIKKLVVPADNNAVLYLWATAPKLTEALEVLEAWGFVYRSQAVWDKEMMGMGYWFRGQHEILLVGARGKISPPPATERVSSVFRVKRGRHSSKPDIIRDLIGKWYPDVPKLEMFSRDALIDWGNGWEKWGNEVEPNKGEKL